jgi:GntR family transcriptional regulator
MNAELSPNDPRAVDVPGSGAAELPDAHVDRASPVPFYFQLAGMLEEEIVSGRWLPGQRVASESELCGRYGLSRTTVRQALSRLEQEGLVVREKGRGTFVNDSRPRSWMIQSTEGFFGDELLRAGRTVTSRILRREFTSLPRWACELLGMPEGSNGFVVERLRSVDGLVALYVVNCLPEFARVAVEELMDDESLYSRLAAAGFAVAGGRRSLEAVGAGPNLARLLEVEASASLAYIESVTRNEDGQPFDCYRAWLRTDRMRLEIEVAASSGAEVSRSLLAAQAVR